MKNDEQEMLAQILATRAAMHNFKLVMELKRTNWSCRIWYLVMLLLRCSPNTEKLNQDTHTQIHHPLVNLKQFWKWTDRFMPIFKY